MKGGDWYKSLSWKLAGVTILVVVIVAAVSGAFFLRIAISRTVEQTELQLTTIATNVDNSVTNLLWSLNEQGLDVAAQDLINDPLIGHVEVRDETGTPVILLSDSPSVDEAGTDVIRHWIDRELNGLQISIPLIHSSLEYAENGQQEQITTTIGELILGPSLDTVDDHVSDRFQASLQAMLLTGLTFALTVFLLSVLNVTRPLNRLSRILTQAEETGQEENLIKELETIRRDDEIGLVAGRFRQVLEQFLAGRDQLASSERSFRDLIEGSVQAWIISREEKVLFCNRAAAHLFGYQRVDDFLGTSMLNTFPLDEQGRAPHIFRLDELAPKETKTLTEEKRIRRDGQEIFVEGLVRSVNWIDGPALQTVLVDTTEKRRVQRELRDMAVKDVMTGLPNRTLFREEVENEIRKDTERFSVMVIGIDRFKSVRDRYGATVADDILRAVAKRLQNALEPRKVVLARLGENIFGVLVRHQGSNARIASIGYAALDCFKNVFDIQDGHITLQASIGIAVYPGDGSHIDELLKNAEIAMDTAQPLTDKRIRLYDAVIGKSILDRMEMEIALRAAINTDAIELFYQPKVAANTGRLCGFEALVRWKKDGAYVPPDHFIPIAEETGLIMPLGEQILKIAAAQVSDWISAHNLNIPVAVNMSALQLVSEKFAHFYKSTVKRYDIPADLLQLELTESATAEYIDDILPILNSLRDFGCMIALDDFGTGYSSLSYLKKMPISYLKLDRSFVEDLPDSDAMALARIISLLGHELGMELIAEGVEDEQTAQILEGMGYDQFQGYHYSKPLSPDEATAWISRAYRNEEAV
ncbi:putative bifunctional diguanylate cyclase/phosphodiesterase [Aestuariispira insulae]|nr:EAL domain-containing protein [Aestuariispira insulae]